MKDHELLFILIIVTIIIYFFINNKEKVKKQCKKKENFIEQPELKATFYEKCDYQGASFELGLGWHSKDKLYIDDKKETIWNSVNSIHIPDGLKVTLYDVKIVKGFNDYLIFSSSVNCIKNSPFNYWKDYDDKITRILVEKNLPSNYNTIKSGYIEKDYNLVKTPETVYVTYDPYGRQTDVIFDTLENCKKKCDQSGDNRDACKAFTRPKQAYDTEVAACYLKQRYHWREGDVSLIEIPNDPEWKTFVKYKGSEDEKAQIAANEKAAAKKEAEARGITVEALAAEKVAKKEEEIVKAIKEAAEKEAAAWAAVGYKVKPSLFERNQQPNIFQQYQVNMLQQQLKNNQDLWNKYMR